MSLRQWLKSISGMTAPNSNGRNARRRHRSGNAANFSQRAALTSRVEPLEARELLTEITNLNSLVTGNGITTIEIGGLSPGESSLNADDGYDQINVDTQAELSGTLRVQLLNNFEPTAGDRFDILTFGNAVGQFSGATGLFGFGDGSLYFEVDSQPSGISLVTRQLVEGPGGSLKPSSTFAADSLGQFLNSEDFSGVLPPLTIAGTFSVGDFLEMRGTFRFASDTDQAVTLADGTTKNVAVISVGASNVDAFAGIGPYFVDSDGSGTIDGLDTPSRDAVGVALTNLDVGLVMMVGNDLSNPPNATTNPAGAVNYPARYLAVKATADSAAFVGTGDAVTAQLLNLTVEINLARSPIQNPIYSPSVVNFSLLPGGGLSVPTGDPANPAVLLNSDEEILSATAGDVLLEVSDFLQVHGTGLAITKGLDKNVTLKNGQTKEVAVLTLGASGLSAFAGIGPYFVDSNNNGRIDAGDTPSSDAVGLKITNLDLGLALMVGSDLTAIPSLNSNPDGYVNYLATYIAATATADRAEVIGTGDSLRAETVGLNLEVNQARSRVQVPGHNPAVIDFTQLAGGGLTVPTGDPANPNVMIRSEREILSATADEFTLSVGNFVYAHGTGLAVEKGPDRDVTLKGSTTTKQVSVLTVGASNIDAFAGIGPYFVDSNHDGTIDNNDTPSADAVGLVIENLDLGLTLMKGSDLSDIPSDPQGAVDYVSTYVAVKATADRATLVGTQGAVTADLRNLTLDVNQATSRLATPLIRPAVVDFSKLAGGGLSVPTNDPTNPTVLINSTRSILSAKAEDVTLAIGEFLYAHGGGIAFEKTERAVTLKGQASTKNVSVLSVGAANLNAFVGLGPYFIDSNNNERIDSGDTPSSTAVGLAIDDLDLGFALMRSTDLTNVPSDPQAAVDYLATYVAGKATAASAQLVGMTDVVTAALRNVTVDVNLATSRLATPLLNPSVVDFTKLAGGGLAIPTGDPTNPNVFLNSSKEIIRAASGRATLEVANTISLDGSIAIAKEETQWVQTAANGGPRRVDILTIGGQNLYGFAGLNGPYRRDTNGDGVISGADTPNSGATGLALDGLTFGMALMKDTIGPNKYVGLKATTNTLSLVGVSGVTAVARNVEVKFNEVTPQPPLVAARLDVVDFTSFPGGKLSVATGGTQTVDLNYNERLLAASGDLTVNVQGLVNVDGVFDVVLSPSRIVAYVDGSGSAGASPLALNVQQVKGLLVIDDKGLGVDLDLRASATLPGNTLINADMKLKVNTSGQSYVYAVPAKFQSRVGYTSLAISAGAPRPDGSFASPGFYVVLDGTGTMAIANTVDIAGDVYAYVTNDEVQINAVGTMTDRANILPSIQVAGDLFLSSAGMVGSLQMAGGGSTSLFNTGSFSLAGRFQLEINTTGSAKSIQVLNYNSEGTLQTPAFVSGSIAANTLRIAGGISLVAGPFTAAGAAQLVFDTNGFAVALDATVDVGFGNVHVNDGEVVVVKTGSETVFAAKLTTNVDLGVTDIGVRGAATLQINTSTTTAYAGVAANTFLVSVHGTLQVMLFKMENVDVTLSSVGGVFRIDFNDLGLDFFGFVRVNVSGFVESDGDFQVIGVGTMPPLNLGPVSFSGSVSLDLRSSGGVQVLKGRLQGAGGLQITLPWPFGGSGAGASATLAGDIELGKASASVALTAQFTFTVTIGIDIPIIGRISKTFTESFSLSGSFAWSWGAPPIIARQEGDTVYLNMGVDGGRRGSLYADLTSENYTITGSGESITVQSLGQTMNFTGVKRIVSTDAGAGNDYIYVGPGITANVVLNGGADNDSLTYLGTGTAVIDGGAGNDLIRGGNGIDQLIGGSGDDRIDGQGGNDVITVNGGSDTVLGGQGNDQILVLGGTNTIYGGEDDDTVTIRGGANTVYGETGNNVVQIDYSNVSIGQTTIVGDVQTDTLNITMNSNGSVALFNDHSFQFGDHTLVFDGSLEAFNITDSGDVTRLGSTNAAGGKLGAAHLTVNANAIELNRDLTAPVIDLFAPNGLTLNDSLVVSGALTMTGASLTTGAAGAISASSFTINVGGAATFGAPVTVSGVVNVSAGSMTGNSTIDAASATINAVGNVTLNNRVNFTGALNVSAGSMTTGSSGALTAGSMSLRASASAVFGGTINVVGAMNITAAGLSGSKNINAGSAVWTIAGAIGLSSGTTVSGNLTASAPGGFTSSSTSPLAVGSLSLNSGNVNLGSTVNVSGAMNVTANSLTATNTVGAGNAGWTISGAVTLNDDVVVTGSMNVSAASFTASTNAPITAGSMTLNTTGAISFGAPVVVNGAMNVTANSLIAQADLRMASALWNVLAGSVLTQGTVTASGALNINSSSLTISKQVSAGSGTWNVANAAWMKDILNISGVLEISADTVKADRAITAGGLVAHSDHHVELNADLTVTGTMGSGQMGLLEIVSNLGQIDFTGQDFHVVNGHLIMSAALGFTDTIRSEARALTAINRGTGSRANITVRELDSLNILNAGLTDGGVFSQNGIVDVELAARDALLKLCSGVISTSTSGQDVRLTADDMDFLSGANAIRGTGELFLQARSATWAYRFGTAAETSAGVPVNLSSSLDLGTRDLAALKDGFSQLRIGRGTAGNTADFGNAIFRDDVTLSADQVTIRGDVAAESATSNVNGDRFEILANALTVNTKHVHNPVGAADSGLSARGIVLDIRDRTIIDGWLRSASSISLQTGSGLFAQSLRVGQFGELSSRLAGGSITIASLDDALVTGMIQTTGANASTVITSQSDFTLTGGWIESKGANSSIAISGKDGVDADGRIIAGLTQAGSISDYNITGAGADVSLMSQHGVRIGGIVASADQLTLLAGSDSSGKSFELDATGLVYTRGTQRVVTINTPDDIELRGKVLVLGDGSDFVVTSAQRILVSNDVLADNRIKITAGADSTGVSYDQRTAGTLTTQQGNVEISGVNDALIFGLITASGANSDVIITFGDYVQLGNGAAPQSITANDDISITTSNAAELQSILGTLTSTLTTRDADGKIKISGPGKVELRGVVTAKGLRSVVDIDSGSEFLLQNGGVIRTELANSEITVDAPDWVGIYGSIIAGVLITERTETLNGQPVFIREYTKTGVNSNVTVTSGKGLDVPGAITASNTMTLSAAADPDGVSMFIGGSLRTLGADTELVLNAPHDVRIFGNVNVDGTNSDLRVTSGGKVVVDGWLQVRDQILVSGGSTTSDGVSVDVTATGRVESFTVGTHDAAHPLQSGNPWQVSMSGAKRVNIDGVVKSIGIGGDVSIKAGDRLRINSAIEADDQILLDGGDDSSGVGVLITTVGGLTSRGAVGGLIEVKSTDSVVVMGHLEARGTGADVLISSERHVSIGGVTADSQGRNVDVGGFIAAPDRIELRGGADSSGISVKVFAASEITTSEIDSSIQIDAVNEAQILGVLLAGGEVINQYDGTRLLGRTFAIFDSQTYGAESRTSVTIHSGNQIVIGLEIHAGRKIEAVGGGDAVSGKSVKVLGSARAVTHSSSSMIYLGGTDRIDILGAPHFKEIEPTGWVTHTNGVLPASASFNISLNLGQRIATHTITVGPSAAPNGNIADIVKLLQDALDSFADFRDSTGKSWFEVTLRNGKVLFTTSGLDFTIKGGTNSSLLGLSTQTVSAVRPNAHLSALAAGSQITLDSAARQLLVAGTEPIGDRGILSGNASFRVTLDNNGTAVIRTITVTSASTATNGNIWGLVDDVQNALNAAGLSQIVVRVKNGRLSFASARAFSIANVANAQLLGLNQATQTSSLHNGGKLYLGGFIEAYSGINLLSGKAVEGNDIEIDVPAVLETIDASIELFAGDEAWIRGDLIAGGAGRDVILSANRKLTLSGNITASDLIELSAGTDVVAREISILTENTSRMLAGNAANGDSGRIVIHGLNDIVIDNSISLTGAGSNLDITSAEGDLFLTESFGIISTAGVMNLQADVLNIDGSINSTASTAAMYEVVLHANEAANLNGSILATGSIHVSSDGSVAVASQLRATGTNSNVRIDADNQILLGGEGRTSTGIAFQKGGLITASNRVDLNAGTNITVSSGSDVLVTQVQGVISLQSDGSVNLVGALHAGARLQNSDNSILWTTPANNASIQIDAVSTVEIGGLGIDNSTGATVLRAGSAQATGQIQINVNGGTANTSLQIGTGSFLKTLGDKADQYEIDIQTDHDFVTTGSLFAQDAGADIRVVAGDRALIAGAIRAADQLVITGGTDSSGTSLLIAPTVFENDMAGQPVFVSGGLLDTNPGGRITLTGAQGIDISGTVGNVYSSSGSQPVPKTNVTDVVITTTDLLTITGLVNARDEITLNVEDLVVALDGVVATREAGSRIDINATGSVYVLKSPTTQNRALVAAKSQIDIDAAYVLITGTVWGQDNGSSIVIHSQQNIDVTGVVDSGDRIEFVAGKTNVSGVFLSTAAGSIQVTSSGQLLAAGSAAGTDSIVLRAATNVDIRPVAEQGNGTLNIPNPFVSQQQYVIQEPVGTRQVIGTPATIQVPVTNYFQTTFLTEVGTVEILVGAEYTTVEVDVDQIGYYNPVTGLQSELGLAGNPLLNRNAGTSDYSIAGTRTYKQLYQVTYKSGSGQFHTTKNGKDLALVADTTALRSLISQGRIRASLASDFTGFVYIEQTDYVANASSLSLKEYRPTWASSQQFQILSAQQFLGVIWNELPFSQRPDWYVKIPVGALAEIKKAVKVSEDALTYEDVGDTWLETDVNLHQIGWWNPATNSGVRDTRSGSTLVPGFQTGRAKPGPAWQPWYRLEYVSGFRGVRTTEGGAYTYNTTSNNNQHEGAPVWATSQNYVTQFMNGRYVEAPATANPLGSAWQDINSNAWTGDLPSNVSIPVNAARTDYYAPVDLGYHQEYWGTFPKPINYTFTATLSWSGGAFNSQYDLHVIDIATGQEISWQRTNGSNLRLLADVAGVSGTETITGSGLTSDANYIVKRVLYGGHAATSVTLTVTLTNTGSNPFIAASYETVPNYVSLAPNTSWTTNISAWQESNVDLYVDTYEAYGPNLFRRTGDAANPYWYSQVSWTPQTAGRYWDQVQVSSHVQDQGNYYTASTTWTLYGGDNNDFGTPNQAWRSNWVTLPDFEDRLHYKWHNVYNTHNIFDPRLHLNYQLVSGITDLYEDRPEYVEVTEQRSETVLVDRTNWLTETVYAPRIVTTVDQVSDTGRDVNYGVFTQESLKATRGNIRIEAGNQVNVRGLVRTLDGSVEINSGEDTNVGGVLPAGANPLTTIAAVAELTATRGIIIFAGRDLHVEQAGLVSVSGTNSLSDIVLDAASRVILDGTVSSLHSVTITADSDVELKGNLTTGTLLNVSAGTGSTQSGSIVGNLEAILTLNGSNGIATLTAGQLSGDITLVNADIRGGDNLIDQVTLTAAAGTVSQTGGRRGIVAHRLSILAANGITANTVVNSADLLVTATGDIVLTEKDAIDLVHAEATNGAITVTAFGDVTATDVRTRGTSDQNDIELNVLAPSSTTASRLIVKSLKSGAAGSIELFVEGNISHATPGVRVETTSLDITAAGSVDLSTTVSVINLRTSRSGDVSINELDSVELADVQIQDGAFSVTSGGTITATDIRMLSNSDRSDVTLTTTSGDIRLGTINSGVFAATNAEAANTIPTSLGDVSLNAAGSITLLNSSPTAIPIVADEARFVAGGSIAAMNVALNTLADVQVNGSGSLVLHDVDGIGELSPGLKIGTVHTANGSVQIDSAGGLSVGYTNAKRQLTQGRILADGTTSSVELTSLNSSLIINGRTDALNVIEAGSGISLLAGRDIVVQGNMTAPERLELRAVGAVNTSGSGLVLSADTLILEAGPSLVVDGTWEASRLIELISNRGNVMITGTLRGRNGGDLEQVSLIARGNRIIEPGILSGLYEYKANGQLYYKDSPEPGQGQVFQLIQGSLTEVFDTSGLDLQPVLGIVSREIKDSLTGLSLYTDAAGNIFYRNVSENRFYRWQAANGRYTFQGINNSTGQTELFFKDSPVIGEGLVYYSDNSTLVANSGNLDLVPYYTEITDSTIIAGLSAITDDVSAGSVYLERGAVFALNRLSIQAQAEIVSGNRPLVVTGTQGIIDLIAGGDITLNSDVRANQRVSLQSTGYTDPDSHPAGGNITVIGNILGSSGMIREIVIAAENNLTLSAVLTAQNLIDLRAGSSIALTQSVTTTSNSGLVRLFTEGALQTVGSALITTNTLDATAASGINLNTSAAILEAHVTGSGDLVIAELNAITLFDITVANGSINVTSGGTLTAQSVISGTDSDANDIILTTSAGSIAAGTIRAGQGIHGDMTLASAAQITDIAGRITADVLTATSAGSMVLETSVRSLIAQTQAAGSIAVSEADAIVLTNVRSANGAISVTAGGQIIATSVVSQTDSVANDITLASAAKLSDAIVPGTINAGALGNVTLIPSLAISGASSVTEGATYSLNLLARLFDDAELSHWTINWGDGSDLQVVNGLADLVTHAYADGSTQHTITATGTDAFGVVRTCNSVLVNVLNVKPTISLAGAAEIDENSLYTLDVNIADPGVLDTFTLVINWGDPASPNNIETWILPASSTGLQTLTLTHRYLNNKLAGTGSAIFSIQATVTDNNGGSDAASQAVLVKNVAPEFEAGVDETLQPVVLGQFSRNGIQASDAGPRDILTGTIDFGDGSGPRALVIDPVTRQFDLSHTFPNTSADPAVFTYTVTITINDGDSGTYTDTFTVTVILNTPPVAFDDVSMIDEDRAITFNVLENDTDAQSNIVPGNTINLTSPSAGLLINNNDGTFTFDPNGDFEYLAVGESATVTFEDQIFDLFGASDIGRVTITITGQNDTPSVTVIDGLVTINEGQTAGNSGSFADVDFTDRPTITASIGTITQDASNNGAWTWSFGANDGPNQSQLVTITANDHHGGVVTTTFSLLVNNVAPNPVVLSSGMIDEDGLFVLIGSFADPGTVDTHTVVIRWGDGSEDTTLTLAAGVTTFTASHRYLDDSGAGVSTVYGVSATVTDKDGESGSGNSNVTVSNVAPALVLNAVTAIIENGLATLTGTITDPGTQDTFTLTITWGDPLSPNNVETYTFAASATGTQSFTLTHRYLDDNGVAGSASDSYTISATVNDKDNQIGTASSSVIVSNVAPVIASLTNSSPDIAMSGIGQTVTISGTFTDMGTQDAHTATINWGNGVTTTGVVTINGGVGTITSSYAYPAGGIYTVTVTLTDDDSGRINQTTSTVIVGVGLVGNTLYIIGGNGNDEVEIETSCGSSPRLVLEFELNGRDQPDQTFLLSQVHNIVILLAGGNDEAEIENGITAPTLIDGGAGNDRLKAGSGNTTLLGGTGDDRLDGGSGINRLEGGDGNDSLYGRSGNDTLLGNAGSDRLDGGDGNDFLDGGDSDDRLSGGKGDDTLIGGAENDDLNGDDGNDVLDAGDGNDKLSGDKGDDTLLGGAGDDDLDGGTGNDSLDGGDGNDDLDGGADNDLLLGGTGNDSITGGEGDDTLMGNPGNDRIDGGEGNDAFDGGDGDDMVYGGSGHDVLRGGTGNDSLYGESGNDIVLGGDGNDVIDGGSGRDLLIGGNGADRLFGGSDDDLLIGNRSTLEDNDEALKQILAEWTSNRTYAARVANLRASGTGTRSNGNTFLNASTVLDDGAIDALMGSSGHDWFLGTIGQDVFQDRANRESPN